MKKIFSIITTIILILFIHQSTSNQTPQNPSINFDKTFYKWSQPFSETVHLIHTKHVNYLADPEKPMINMIKSFVKSFDPHSYFLDQKGYEDIIQSVKGELTGGIGIIVDNTKDADDEFLRIVETIPGGPADKVGIKAQDKIVEVEGEPVKGMAVDEIVSKLKGKRNTKVHVKVLRSDTTRMLPFDITRDVVKEPNALCYHFKGHDAYYICFNMFTENSINQLTQVIQKIQSQQNTKGLIIDLRNNTGGLLDAAIDIASLFLPKNSLVVITKGRQDKEIDRFYTKKDPILNRSIPIFILVNNFTASAAEILPGALQVHADKAKKDVTGQHVYIVGNKTYGKGTWQEVIPICNNCAIALTAGVYCLPDGSCVQGKGITPDFLIEAKMPPSQETIWYNTMFGRESALKNAIKQDQEADNPMLKDTTKKEDSKKEQEKSWYEKKRDIISSDYSILSTLRLLEMFDMAQKAYPEKMKTRADSITLLKSLYTPEDKAEIEEITIANT
jgi:carboxyl-terminal processing protease